MAQSTDPMAGEPPAAERAGKQQNAGDWPRPGEEGYVHPDGTAQAQGQLADNRCAAADRAAAGSIIHGAPGATPGTSADLAAQRAQDYSGPSTQQAHQDLTRWVADKRTEVTNEAPAPGPAPADTSQRSPQQTAK